MTFGLYRHARLRGLLGTRKRPVDKPVKPARRTRPRYAPVWICTFIG